MQSLQEEDEGSVSEKFVNKIALKSHNLLNLCCNMTLLLTIFIFLCQAGAPKEIPMKIAEASFSAGSNLEGDLLKILSYMCACSLAK